MYFLGYINLDGLIYTLILTLALPLFILLIISLLLYLNNKRKSAKICLIISTIYLVVCIIGVWGMMMT